MKRILYLFMLAALIFFTGCENKEQFSSVNGLFSVAEGRQVRFAAGNLEYSDGYHFAVHQYDYGGYFGWGTGNNPTLTSIDNEDYLSFDDWGNHIGDGWRTLSKDEWHYVISDRNNASAKCGAATVCDVHGIVLLPDNFSGGTFHPGFDNGWSTNVYNASSWSTMEDDGAVFLPAAGYRFGTEMSGVGAYGIYWSSTPDGEDYACNMYFDDTNVDNYGYGTRGYGRSVRLVRDY